MERETQILELPHSKKKIKLFTFITAGELFEARKSKNKIMEKIIKLIVVDVDGKVEEIYEKEILSLPIKDYTVLDETLSKMIKDDDEEESEKNE